MDSTAGIPAVLYYIWDYRERCEGRGTAAIRRSAQFPNLHC